MSAMTSVLFRGAVLFGFFSLNLSPATSECSQEEKSTVTYLANHLDVRYGVLRNFDSDDDVTWCQVNLTNAGQLDITAGPVQWSIYLSHSRDIQGVSESRIETELPDTGLKVVHINGDLFRMRPASTFVTMTPGTTLTIQFYASSAMIAVTDILPNWYVSAGNCSEAYTILSTAREPSEFSLPFDRADKWKKSKDDLYDPYSPDQRYERSNTEDSGGTGMKTNILPTPVEVYLNEGKTVDIRRGGWVIVDPENELTEAAKYLADALDLAVVPPSPAPPSRRLISIQLGPVQNPNGLKLLEGPEAYQLDINADDEVVTLTAMAATGIFYAVQSLLSLEEYGDRVPDGTVRDGPRFPYRGMHLDVGRNFHPVDDVVKLIDVMAMYKMNHLHFHLSDDEGWRLEILPLPELTQVASRRCHDPTGNQCFLPQLGSGPSLSNRGTGYYTVDDYRSILAYAEKRHVRVIPEFDMPGHSSAAINAMLARYRKYESINETAAREFLLSDFDDESQYLSAQRFNDGAMNPCMESTYKFIDTVVASVKAIHAGVQPLTLYHVGGDEVPPGAWVGSPICQERNASSAEDLKMNFMIRAADIIAKQGVQMVAWEDGIYHGQQPINITSLGGGVHATVWDNVWEWGAGKRAYELANNGYKVIVAHATHLYFDHPLEPDPEERGLYWATRVTQLDKVFGFMPDSLYENIGLDSNGKPLNQSAVCSMYGCPPLADETSRENVIGMQGQLWCEVIRSSDKLTSMIFPRLLALAERSWHRAAFELETNETVRNDTLKQEWRQFANTLGHKELLRLDRRGVQYNIAPAGARIDPDNPNRVFVTSGLPGLPVVYSIDQEVTWSTCGNEIVLPPETKFPVDIRILVLSADRSRSSRPVHLTLTGK